MAERKPRRASRNAAPDAAPQGGSAAEVEDRTAALAKDAALKQDDDAPPWERLRGESAKQFAAFQAFLELEPYQRSVAEFVRQQHAAGKRAGKHSSAEACRRYHWRARALAWDEEQAATQRRETKRALTEMTASHIRSTQFVRGIADMHLQRVARQIREQINSDPQAVPDYLEPRDLLRWLTEGQRMEVTARQRARTMADEALSQLTSDAVSEAEAWRAKYVEPERSFIPHTLQRALIHSTKRFCCAVAGVQSGKTAGTAIAFWNRLLEEGDRLRESGDGPGFYWLIAPNSLVGEVMCEAFENFAPPNTIVKGLGGGSKSGKTWVLADGARVQFRSAEKADTLVARRLHGAWLDEFTLLKPDVWVTSVRQRLVTTGGWAYFSGTPRGKNWAWEEIWRRCLVDDDKYDVDYDGYTWHSEENPTISKDEIDAAQRQLPEAYFNREYRASWESFHGQIYEHWDASTMLVKGLAKRRAPYGADHFIGVDWGTASPGAAVVLRRLPHGEWHVVEEVHVAAKLPAWWNEKIAELWEKWKVKTIFCDPEDKGRLLTLVSLGMPAVRANNAVHAGIGTVAGLVKQNLFLVDAGCKITAMQTESYHWKQDPRGNRQERPTKENDHACDAVRYVLHTHKTIGGGVEVERTGYSGSQG